MSGNAGGGRRHYLDSRYNGKTVGGRIGLFSPLERMRVAWVWIVGRVESYSKPLSFIGSRRSGAPKARRRCE